MFSLEVEVLDKHLTYVETIELTNTARGIVPSKALPKTRSRITLGTIPYHILHGVFLPMVLAALRLRAQIRWIVRYEQYEVEVCVLENGFGAKGAFGCVIPSRSGR